MDSVLVIAHLLFEGGNILYFVLSLDMRASEVFFLVTLLPFSLIFSMLSRNELKVKSPSVSREEGLVEVVLELLESDSLK